MHGIIPSIVAQAPNHAPSSHTRQRPPVSREDVQGTVGPPTRTRVNDRRCEVSLALITPPEHTRPRPPV